MNKTKTITKRHLELRRYEYLFTLEKSGFRRDIPLGTRLSLGEQNESLQCKGNTCINYYSWQIRLKHIVRQHRKKDKRDFRLNRSSEYKNSNYNTTKANRTKIKYTYFTIGTHHKM
jgi:hypothetical protein